MTTPVITYLSEGDINVSETFKKLFPNIPLLIATIIAFIIVFGFLTYFFYKPVKKMLERRNKFIQKNIDDSIRNKKLALESSDEAQERLMNAKITAAEIIDKAKFEAEKVIIEYTTRANKEAELIKSHAEIDIKNEKEKFEKESRQAIIDVAFEIANKIVKKEIKPENEQKLIEDYFK
ncbi:ATP synthase F0, B subunit [Mycoplasmopsis californica]|uniref:ATP synthase subunit b n=1 Tax=Mycoplasmopsis equigenitalium TaxID=114883 RepID=A0ABY5J202_9BACT|nr:F0F1 ATP synthase subunit B [Mycoplasmopsis equigenitalium]UUD37292.1 F0F1 ATP synthase subunit B [Mycoplasmopsis equigenitalium]VEU69398.1 ATP synthase F0, B subunit [Mycoplasmopsis californica]